MTYPYRHPRLRMDLPQPDPDSRIVLNEETGRYVRLGRREFDWLNKIDGRTHVRDLPRELREDATLIDELVRRMTAARLLCLADEPVSVETTQALPNPPRQRRTFSAEGFGRLRIDIGEPRRILERLLPVTRRVLSPQGGYVALAIFIGAIFLGLAYGHAFVRTIAEFHWRPSAVAILVALVFTTTVIHEFGHAVVCYHYGAPVRSMGVMIYYLQPVAYADVTDAWQLKSRYQRVAISVAGIVVQIIAASAAMWFWSLLRLAGHSVAILPPFVAATVALTVFNAVPFAKLDGYWALSNILGLPNLRDRSIEWARATFRAMILGIPINPRTLRYNAVLSMPSLDRALLAAFGATSMSFGVAMWAGGVVFLLRVARWLGAGPRGPYFVVIGLISSIAIIYLRHVVRSRAGRATAAVPESRTDDVGQIINDNRLLRLSPYVSIFGADDGTLTFGVGAYDALTVNADHRFIEAVPRLRQGSVSLRELKESSLWTNESPQILRYLWEAKHLRYRREWDIANAERYSRQVGWFAMHSATRGRESEAMELLRSATVTVLGLGGLGTHVAWNLAACGVGELRLIDGDLVDVTNLNRQLLYRPSDVGLPKVAIAMERLLQFNPELRVVTKHKFLESVEDVADAVAGSSFVVRAIDTPNQSLSWVNAACVRLRIPYVGGGFFPHGAIVGPTVLPLSSPCLACLPAPKITRADRGVGGTLAPIVAMAAGIVACEVINYIAKLGVLQTIGRVLSIRTPPVSFSFADIIRDSACIECGSGRAERALG